MSAWLPMPLRHFKQRLRNESPTDNRLLAFFQDKADSRGYQLSDGQRRVIQAMAEQLALL
ncbi:hypothetical protein WP4W18C03_16790 [Pseudomonas putida]|nr:hypothetical protein WP4W18C03_16790 [Pseudomonas putida]